MEGINNNKEIKGTIILDDAEFFWTKKDIRKVISLYNDGRSIRDMAAYLQKSEIDVTLILLHLAKNKKIVKTKINLWCI